MRRCAGVVGVVALLLAPGTRAETVGSPYALLIDYPNGRELLAKQADAPMVPASLAKLMTLLVAFDALKRGEVRPDQIIRVSAIAARQPGAGLKLRPGDNLSIRHAIDATAVASANDAAHALAEAIAGSERAFVARMNARAKSLGLAARFANATGHHDRHQTISARAVALLVSAILREYPDRYRIFAQPQFVFNGVTYANRNPILATVAGADGVKTGQLRQAGYVLAGSAVRDGRRLILVLGGAPSEQARADDARRAFEWGFAQSVR
ncbi:MAG: D-alanyl-D-alanine carboxypeptidase family protein [Alphaproteobacteria bacterium]